MWCRLYILSIGLCLWSVSLSGQTTDWRSSQSFFGYNVNDEAQAVITTRNGGMAIVGYANPPRKSGKDILLVLQTETGVDTMVHGRSQDEEAYAVAQTPQGAYVVVGYSSSPAKGYRGKQDGLFALISEDGRRVLEDTLLGSEENDVFHAVALDARGDYLLAGQRAGQFWVVKRTRSGQIAWEYSWPTDRPTQAEAIRVLPNGNIAVVGTTDEKRWRYTGHYVLLSPEGKALQKQAFPGDQLKDLIYTPEGHLVITGIAPEQRDNLLLLKTDLRGDTIWRKSHQGNYNYDNHDAGHALSLTAEGNYCVAGVNSSSLRGLNRNIAWVSIYNQAGEMLRDTLLGGDSEDSAQDICLTADGGLAMAGFSASGRGAFRDAWLVRFQAAEFDNRVTQLELDDIAFFDATGDGILEGGEEAAIQIRLTNTGEKPSAPTRLSIQATDRQGVQLPDRLSVGLIPPGASQAYTIPILGQEDLSKGELQIRIFAEDTGLRIPPITIPTRKAQRSKLVLLPQTKESFLVEGGGKPGRGQQVIMQVGVANQGEREAQDLELRFVLPEQVQSLSSPQHSLARLAGGDAHTFQLALATDLLYHRDTVAVKVQLRYRGQAQQMTKTYRLALKPFRSFQEEEKPVVVAPAQEYLQLQWISPAADKVIRGTLPWEDSLFSIKLIARSSQPLVESHFRVRHNGMVLNSGKFRNVSLEPSDRNTDGSGESYVYNFSMEGIQLLPGENIFQIEVANRAGRQQADELRVDYLPPKQNLHIISIGVPQYDLQFTTKDARDFADALAAQEGVLFEQVYSKILDTKARTTTQELRKAFRNLAYDYEGNKIRPQDVMVIFISTHGQTNRKQEMFRLAGSEYDVFYPLATSIDYKQDLVDMLSTVNCKKMVFIDACNSGGVSYVDAGLAAKSASSTGENLANALTQLMEAQAGLRALASCQSDEKSYEDERWQNGAFTEAILEAFANTEVEGLNGKLRANTDDSVLTLAELHDFLIQRVPHMVSKIGNAKTSQTPYLVEKYREEVLPLFFYGE